MQKEKLTFDEIQTDIQDKMKEGYKKLALFSTLFLIMFALILTAFHVMTLKLVFECFMGIVAEAFLLFLILRQIKNLTMLNSCFNTTECIVKDRLINAEFIDRHSRKVRYERYHLTFSQYGNYVIPNENYKWSSTFSMSDVGVYNYANSGDEFYLVLSKPHTGKILFAYNTKMFELED